MIFISSTSEDSSLDLYARRLAENLDVPSIETDILSKQTMGVRLASLSAAKVAWHGYRFLREMKRIRDSIHFPNQHFGRFGMHLKVPYVITVHDIIRYFDMFSDEPFIGPPTGLDRRLLSLDYRGVREAAAVIAVSQKTKDDLVEFLEIPENRVFVAHNGVDHARFHPVKRRVLDFRYVLYVGSEHPRKNIATILDSMRLLKGRAECADLKLVMVGGPPSDQPFRNQTLAAIAERRLEDDVMLMGRVPADDLPAYYSGARCLAFPSLSEGFGLPLIEAMACGCPVVISNVGALPEVAAGAASVVDPRDSVALANRIAEFITDTDVRRTKSEQGLKRAADFTWKRAARLTMDVYRQLEGPDTPAPLRRDH